MLCKASLMNDENSFYKILLSDYPNEVKKLGKNITNSNQLVWNQHVCLIAKEVIFKKFSQVEGLKNILLMTKNHLLANTNQDDLMWGIGKSENDQDSQYPSRWTGSNILGWALMEVRDLNFI